MIGTLYGVGVGPGDPKLLTLQAVEILTAADIIAVPDTGGEKTALTIAAPYIENKPLLLCSMPMTRDPLALSQSHEKTAAAIIEQLKQGKNVAFITLGDPSIYSTYMYVHRLVEARGYTVQMIAGIPSFCAVAAALNVSLCDGKEALHIIPASYDGGEEALCLQGNKVLMKSGKSLKAVKEQLHKLGLQAQMVERCSMEGQKIYHSMDEVPDDSSYFSIIVVK